MSKRKLRGIARSGSVPYLFSGFTEEKGTDDYDFMVRSLLGDNSIQTPHTSPVRSHVCRRLERACSVPDIAIHQKQLLRSLADIDEDSVSSSSQESSNSYHEDSYTNEEEEATETDYTSETEGVGDSDSSTITTTKITSKLLEAITGVRESSNSDHEDSYTQDHSSTGEEEEESTEGAATETEEEKEWREDATETGDTSETEGGESDCSIVSTTMITSNLLKAIGGGRDSESEGVLRDVIQITWLRMDREQMTWIRKKKTISRKGLEKFERHFSKSIAAIAAIANDKPS